MQIDLTKVSYEGRVFDFGDAKLTIRPYPKSRVDIIIKDGAMVLSGASALDMFIYCLTKWENVPDANGNPLKLSVDIKQKIYDFHMGVITDEKGEKICMSDFVIRTARGMSEENAAETKN